VIRNYLLKIAVLKGMQRHIAKKLLFENETIGTFLVEQIKN